MNKAWSIIFLATLLLSSSVLAAGTITKSSMKIFAVTSDGKGLSADLTLEMIPGSGRVWSSTSPLVGTTTQSAEQTAIKLAQSYGHDARKYDYLFDIQSNASVVEGPSAGSAMAFLVVTALQGKTISKEVGMTGTIAEDGSIGPVGGVLEKAKEANRIGIKLFLIPKGEGKQTIRDSGKVESVYLPDYALKNWGMKVIEVNNLDEALTLAFQPIGQIDVNDQNQTAALPEYIPTAIQFNPTSEPLYRFSKGYLPQVTQLITTSRNSLSTTLINDPELVNALLQELSDAEDALKDAEILIDKNYLFSAANSIFLTRVLTATIDDISENPSILESDSTVFTGRLTQLRDKINSLKNQLDEGMPIDSIEWYIAARQRLAWAEYTLEQLEQPTTVIIVNGQSQDEEKSKQIKRIQDLEFAQSWLELAQQFYNEGRYSKKMIPLDDSFQQVLDETLIQAENQKKADETGEDILRRLNAAKLQKKDGSYASGFFDAVSAVYLIQSKGIESETDYDQLDAELQSHIKMLDQNIKDSNASIVWGQLYLDHAKYYLNGAHFYQSTSQGARATQFLQNGLSVMALAEANFLAAKAVHEAYDNTPESRFIKKSNPTDSNAPTSSNSSDFMLIGGIALILLLTIALVGSVVLNRSPRSTGLTWLKKESTPAQQEQFSKHVLQMDKLHARFISLERMVRDLKSHYHQGLIQPSDYEAEMKQLLVQMSALQEELQSSTSEKPSVSITKKKKTKDFVRKVS